MKKRKKKSATVWKVNDDLYSFSFLRKLINSLSARFTDLVKKGNLTSLADVFPGMTHQEIADHLLRNTGTIPEFLHLLINKDQH